MAYAYAVDGFDWEAREAFDAQLLEPPDAPTRAKASASSTPASQRAAQARLMQTFGMARG